MMGCGAKLFPRFEPRNYECLASEQADSNVDHTRPRLTQDHLKDPGMEPIEHNLAGEGKEAQPVFLSASLKAESKQMLLNLLRELKDVFM